MLAAFRSLPSVERLASSLIEVPSGVATAAAREVIEAERKAIEQGTEARARDELVADTRLVAERIQRPRLRRLINATGVILHTNLGRAPLAREAIAAIEATGAGYSNLEYDLEQGTRGSRQAHIGDLLLRLTGAEGALAVNNGAAASLLACTALGAGREIIVSRGQLVEIGGSFRIPDIVAQSGGRLVEVGTTNRTRLADYESAIGPDTGVILRVHQSNFRTVGFVESVEIEQLCELGHRADVPVIDDIGSGALAEGIPEFGDEPRVRRSVVAGATLTCFSGDKLLGGPQAGLVVGRAEAIERCRSHPLARVLRIDKLSVAALEATLRLYLDPTTLTARIPVLRMLTATDTTLKSRAEAIRERLEANGVKAQVIEVASTVGGGALPLTELRGPACAVDPDRLGVGGLSARLRAGMPPVVTRAHEGWVLLDPRTLTDEEAGEAADAVAKAFGESSP